MDGVIEYLLSGVTATFQQVLMMLGPGLVLAFIMHQVSGIVERRASRTFGHGFWMWAGAPGTIVHELGHALFCVIFRHKITEMKLFSPDPERGTLGYVAHSHNPNSRYQKIGNFFIGTGPIWLGTVVVFVLAKIMVGNEFSEPLDSIFSSQVAVDGSEVVKVNLIDTAFHAVSITWTILGNFMSFELLTNWSFYLFVYLLFTIGNGITLSPPDIQGSIEGGIALVVGLLLFNWCFMWLGDMTSGVTGFIGRYSVYFFTVMAVVLFVNIVISIAVLFTGSLAKSILGKFGLVRT